MTQRKSSKQARSDAATWFEQLKDYDRGLQDASDARSIVSLCDARAAHLLRMPPAAAAYGFPWPVDDRARPDGPPADVYNVIGGSR